MPDGFQSRTIPRFPVQRHLPSSIVRLRHLPRITMPAPARCLRLGLGEPMQGLHPRHCRLPPSGRRPAPAGAENSPGPGHFHPAKACMRKGPEASPRAPIRELSGGPREASCSVTRGRRSRSWRSTIDVLDRGAFDGASTPAHQLPLHEGTKSPQKRLRARGERGASAGPALPALHRVRAQPAHARAPRPTSATPSACAPAA